MFYEVPDMFYGAKPDLFEKAKMLRNNMTLTEKQLWCRINKNQLGVRFKAQHPIDIFIVDFYCHKCRLVIEVDGQYHNYLKEEDSNRTNELESFGLQVIRFTNEDILFKIESVIEKIKSEVHEFGS